MEKVNYWAKALKTWLPIALGLYGIFLLISLVYVQDLYSMGRDPFAEDSDWIWALPYLLFGLLSGVMDILILVFLICFMLRAAQLIKSVSPDEFAKRPGWAIWGFFIPFASVIIPYQVLRSIKNFARSDEFEAAATKKLLLLFWIPYALSSYLANRSLLYGGLEPTYSELQVQSVLDVVVAVTVAFSWVCLLKLVPRLLSGMQKRLDGISNETPIATA